MTASASALVNPQPYLDEAYSTQFDRLVLVNDVPDTFPAEWASAETSVGVGEAATALPAFSTLGYIALYVDAFALGWKIGRTVDTRFLHLSGLPGQRIDFTTSLIASGWEWWTGCVTDQVVGSVDYFYPAGCTSTSHYWVWSATTSGGTRVNVWRSACNSSGGSCGTFYDQMGGQAGRIQAAAHVRLSEVHYHDGLYGSDYWCNPTIRSQYSNGQVQCRFLYMTPTDMKQALVVDRDTSYTGQAFDRSTTFPIASNTALTTSQRQAARDYVSNLTDAYRYEINAALDPGHWVRPDPATGVGGGPKWQMPDCIGGTVAACEAAATDAASTAGTSVTYAVTVAMVPAADLTKSAGAVLSTSPTGATWNRPPTVSIVRNPDPMPLVWPAPSQPETYLNYLSRLRANGWLGTASISSLPDSLNDPLYGPNGVPCTDVVAGTRIMPGSAVTFYSNGDDPSGGIGGADCSGGSATPTPGECDYDEAITYVKWETMADPANTPPEIRALMDQACADAWAHFQDLGGIAQDPTDFLTRGEKLGNDEVRAYLASAGPIENFRKVEFGPYVVNGRTFVVHAYRNVVTNEYMLAKDFKVKFRDVIQ